MFVYSSENDVKYLDAQCGWKYSQTRTNIPVYVHINWHGREKHAVPHSPLSKIGNKTGRIGGLIWSFRNKFIFFSFKNIINNKK